jgi:16S rRNA (adenine1518-N6/adenine1519-N6)-dimethyltransferase
MPRPTSRSSRSNPARPSAAARARRRERVAASPISGALLASGVRPSKLRGQNFLTSTAVAARIVDALAPARGDEVIEIGPGLGILSERIAACPVARLVLVELDERLARRLEERFRGDRRVRIINQDFLALDLARVAAHPPVKVIGNLPFNAAAAILRKLCGYSRMTGAMVLMFQREVGERIRARPGHEGYAALSVFTALYFEIVQHFRVAAGSFHPRPKVDAEVLVMRPRGQLPFEPAEETNVLETIRASFAMPRKTIRNSLAGALGIESAQIERALAAAGIDPGARASTLAADDFIRLAHARQIAGN